MASFARISASWSTRVVTTLDGVVGVPLQLSSRALARPPPFRLRGPYGARGVKLARSPAAVFACGPADGRPHSSTITMSKTGGGARRRSSRLLGASVAHDRTASLLQNGGEQGRLARRAHGTWIEAKSQRVPSRISELRQTQEAPVE
jgi:hypothetical protein